MLTFILYGVLGFISLLAAHLLHFNWIIGSFHAHFSCISLVLPAFIKYFGFAGIFLLYGTKVLSVKNLYAFILAKSGLIFSSYTYIRINFFTSFLLPAACMIAFIMHPVGNTVYFYSFYWFIPMLLYVFYRNNIFAQALTASFIAHALGSIIWLYFYQLDSLYWVAAFPVVPFERFIMAFGIVVFDKIYAYMFATIKKFQVHNIS